jgi:hypothetical protein
LITALLFFFLLIASFHPVLSLSEFKHHIHEFGVLCGGEDPIEAHKALRVHLLHADTTLVKLILLDVLCQQEFYTLLYL